MFFHYYDDDYIKNYPVQINSDFLEIRCFPTQRGIIKFSHNNRLFAQNVDFSAVNN